MNNNEEKGQLTEEEGQWREEKRVSAARLEEEGDALAAEGCWEKAAERLFGSWLKVTYLMLYDPKQENWETFLRLSAKAYDALTEVGRLGEASYTVAWHLKLALSRFGGVNSPGYMEAAALSEEKLAGISRLEGLPEIAVERYEAAAGYYIALGNEEKADGCLPNAEEIWGGLR